MFDFCSKRHVTYYFSSDDSLTDRHDKPFRVKKYSKFFIFKVCFSESEVFRILARKKDNKCSYITYLVNIVIQTKPLELSVFREETC